MIGSLLCFVRKDGGANVLFQGRRDHTKHIHICTILLVKNQNMKVPTSGIEWGYLFFARSSICCGDIRGPGKLRGGGRLSRAGWDGGLNLLGFSKTLGLRVGVDGGVLEEAYRHRSSCFRAIYNDLSMPGEVDFLV